MSQLVVEATSGPAVGCGVKTGSGGGVNFPRARAAQMVAPKRTAVVNAIFWPRCILNIGRYAGVGQRQREMLFSAERDHWVGAGGAVGGNPAGEQGNGGEEQSV